MFPSEEEKIHGRWFLSIRHEHKKKLPRKQLGNCEAEIIAGENLNSCCIGINLRLNFIVDIKDSNFLALGVLNGQGAAANREDDILTAVGSFANRSARNFNFIVGGVVSDNVLAIAVVERKRSSPSRQAAEKFIITRLAIKLVVTSNTVNGILASSPIPS